MTETSWGGGYVTDISYIAGFHSIQSQALMALAALLNNFHARPIRRDEPYHLCDIGCGLGITPLIVAAANPGWQVTGLDFNPAHIAAAREMAREAGVANVQFLEADLRDFAATTAAHDLPAFDAVTMHGVWSWVDSHVQDGILRLLNTKLLAGGLFYVSYNAAAAWQSAIGLQRLVREAGLRLASRSDRQAASGLEVAEALAKAGGPVSYMEGFGKSLVDRFTGLPIAYVAHEMMNAHWAPCWHLDVASRMAQAKLEFAGSARLMNNFPELTLSAEQRAVLGKFDDPLMTELFKDICRPQLLRNDVFIRGARRIDAVSRDAALGEIALCLTADAASWKFEFDAANGTAQMAEGYYRPIFTRLLAGPATVRELLSLPDLQGKRDNPAELIGVAIGTEQTMPMPNPGVQMDDRCARLNSVLLRNQLAAGQGSATMNFAVPSLGGGMTLPGFEGMVVHELAANPHVTSPVEMASKLGARQTPDEQVKLAERLRSFFLTDGPLLRNFGFAL